MFPWFSFSWYEDPPIRITTEEGDEMDLPWYKLFNLVKQ